MSFSVKLGNFLYKNAFGIYKPMYKLFKNRQDAFEISLLKKYIKKNDIVLDIGANIGFYATLLSEMVGEIGVVHCFEPDRQNFEYLTKATSNFKNIRINNKAVGPKTEKIKIYTSKNLNVDHRTYKPEEYDKEIEIDAICMDDYLASNLHVNFIKIDIQGFEMAAMQGLQRILAENKHIKMISEFWPYGLKQAGSSATAYFIFLTENGFTCYLLEQHALQKLTTEKVESLELLGTDHYFNIYATRTAIN